MGTGNSVQKLTARPVRRAKTYPTVARLLLVLAATVVWIASTLLLHLICSAPLNDDFPSIKTNILLGALERLSPRRALLDQPENHGIVAEQQQKQPVVEVEKDGENMMNKPNSDMNGSPPPAQSWLLDQHVAHTGSSGTSATAMRIPRVINKVFLQKMGGFDNPLNEMQSLQDAHATWTDRNPGYEMRYYDLRRCRKYLTDHYHPVFLRAFDCLQSFAAKADFFRYALIYREGGWYSDWKEVCLTEGLLDDLSRSGTLWVAGLDRGSGRATAENCVQNSFFGAEPRHPILKEMLSLVLENVRSQFYEGGPLFPTGPCAFGAAHKRSGAHGERGSRIGVFRNGYYIFDGRAAAAVRHKCEGCREGQSWGDSGNNYNKLYRRQDFYCEDAPSLFHSVSETL